MRIVQINTADRGGGAEGSAWNLFTRYRDLGHESQLVVGRKVSSDAGVVEIPRECPWLGKPVSWLAAGARSLEGRVPGMRFLGRCFDRGTSWRRFREWFSGTEESFFPGCRRLPEVMLPHPDVIHCHNLHGYFFDLGMLPALSRLAPVVLNLRDTWAVAGHCAYFTDCDKWRTGCGNCPRLDVYPAIRKDRTAENWRRKAAVYGASKLYVTAPSQWMVDVAKASMLQAVEYRVIPNGIDTEVFKPGSRTEARAAVGLPQGVPALMFAAAAKSSYFKDSETLWAAAKRLLADNPSLVVVVVGISLPKEFQSDRMFGVPFVRDSRKMALYYRSADVFMHTAKAEAFGKTVTEAMACGTPVVASAVGGLTEQILDGVTGALARPGDSGDLVAKVKGILSCSPEERASMGAAAAARGSQYSLTAQADGFLSWYQEIRESWQAQQSRG